MATLQVPLTPTKNKHNRSSSSSGTDEEAATPTHRPKSLSIWRGGGGGGGGDGEGRGMLKRSESKYNFMSEESIKFGICYEWLLENMSGDFFNYVGAQAFSIIAHHLIHFESLEQPDVHIRFAASAIVVGIEDVGTDETVLEHYGSRGMKNYRTFLSTATLPGIGRRLRVTRIGFTEFKDTERQLFTRKEELRQALAAEVPTLVAVDFDAAVDSMNQMFLASIPFERLVTMFKLYMQASQVDFCQWQWVRNDDWQETEFAPSAYLLLAWRNTLKRHLMYNVATVARRHQLVFRGFNCTFLRPYTCQNVLLMHIGFHGVAGQPAWEAADLDLFMQEITLLKPFRQQDIFRERLVNTLTVSGLQANILRSMSSFINQVLADLDPYAYSTANVREALSRHPEVTTAILRAFELKFHPRLHDAPQASRLIEDTLAVVRRLDTGKATHDARRKAVLTQALHMIRYTLKTNAYVPLKVGHAYRLDPAYLDHTPFDRKKKYPELPYAVFFVKGRHFFGFHVRFRDLARGGMRTIVVGDAEASEAERANMFTECYNLAYTQQKKNKDIPEGGAKAILFLAPNEELSPELDTLRAELVDAGTPRDEQERIIAQYQREQTLEYLYCLQRAFVYSLMSLINCDDATGRLRDANVVDHYGRAEYLYLGPDENCHDSMIQWIADYSKSVGYKPAGAFISGKKTIGFNHKHYGVTSLGVYVYMRIAARAIGIDVEKQPFTIKITGGPDGDVAGNMILNLARHCATTARLLVVTDGSGTIYDPEGLDLPTLVAMFHRVDPIAKYPAELLHDGGFLLDRSERRQKSSYEVETLQRVKRDGKVVEEWLGASQANAIFRTNAHSVRTDIFVPGGGRPRTLDANWEEFLEPSVVVAASDAAGTALSASASIGAVGASASLASASASTLPSMAALVAAAASAAPAVPAALGRPTARLIVEGANLYLTELSRTMLEKQGVLIIKDSSANKCGVITSSYEILCSLALTEEQFLAEKDNLIADVLHILEQRAAAEAELLLRERALQGVGMCAISDQISQKINEFTDSLMAYLETIELPADPAAAINQCYLSYCPKTLRTKFQDALLARVPAIHRKAVIACSVAAGLVYRRGLKWQPSLADVLPLVLNSGDYF